MLDLFLLIAWNHFRFSFPVVFGKTQTHGSRVGFYFRRFRIAIRIMCKVFVYLWIATALDAIIFTRGQHDFLLQCILALLTNDVLIIDMFDTHGREC